MLPRNALHSLTARRHQRSTTRECSCADQSSHYKTGVDPVTALLPRSNSPPQWRIQFALFSRNSPHPLYLSLRTGTRSSTCLDPCASALTDPDNLGVYLIRAYGLTTPSCPAPGVSLGGLVPSPNIPVLGGLAPSPDIPVLGGLPLTSDDFRTHRAPIPSPSATICPCRPRATFPQAPYTTYAINARDDAPRPTRRK